MDKLNTYLDKIKEIPSIELLNKLVSLKNINDLSTLLDEKLNILTYYCLVEKVDKKKYREFTIPKKTGGVRTILAPNRGLKRIQRKLNMILQKIYEENSKSSAHGFLHKKSIVTNAQNHINKKFVLNIDLSDFFPSISFVRVKGLLCSKPFGINEQVSHYISNLCCYQGYLPQGAPTSPILSNMICYRLDGELQKLANQNNCKYTRYADDITFSTKQQLFPNDVGIINKKDSEVLSSFSNIRNSINEISQIKNFKIESLLTNDKLTFSDMLKLKFNEPLSNEQIKGIRKILINEKLQGKFIDESLIVKNRIADYQIELSPKIVNIIEKSGFKINFNKVRAQGTEHKQEVTGIKVNTKLNLERRYIRYVRVLLHSWEKDGLEKAQIKFNLANNKIKEPSKKGYRNIVQVLKGKIEYLGQVKGKEDEIYRKTKNKFNELCGKSLNLPIKIKLSEQELKNKIISDLQKEIEIIKISSNEKGLNIDLLNKKLSKLSSKLQRTRISVGELRKFFNSKYEITGNIAIYSNPEQNNSTIDSSNSILKINDIEERMTLNYNTLNRQIDGLFVEVEKVKQEIDFDVEPSNYFTFIKEQNIREKIVRDNKKMMKALKNKDDFFEYCRWSIIQLEGFMKFIVNNDIIKIKSEKFFHYENKWTNYQRLRETIKYNLDNIFYWEFSRLLSFCLAFYIDDLNKKINGYSVWDIYWEFINAHTLRNIPSHGDYNVKEWWLSINESKREYTMKYFENKKYEKLAAILELLINQIYINRKEY